MKAYSITCTLQGRWYGSYGCGPCPVCQPEGRTDQGALTISEGAVGLLLHCKKAGCQFRDIIAALKLRQTDKQRSSKTENRRSRAFVPTAYCRSDMATKIWDSACPIEGTLAETYLQSRAINCALPDTLRFHPELWHGLSRRALPAMIAQIEGSAGVAIHRSWVRHDGSGKADVIPTKAMLGKTAGGAVRLAKAAGPLVVAEGIETALSLICLLHHPASVWAALSTSGLRGLILPDEPGRLVLAPDGDDAGRAAANALAERARKAGWRVLQRDPGDYCDWNDVLRAGSVS